MSLTVSRYGLGDDTGFQSSDIPKIKGMTIEEKVGQLMMVHLRNEEVDDTARIVVQEVAVGGIIYYNWLNRLNSPEKIDALSRGLQNLAVQTRLRIPLLISTDQEGGRVARFRDGFSTMQSNAEVENPTVAEEAASTVGKELSRVGINMNLAPVVDIASNPDNPVIGSRSFSNNADDVVKMARGALKGYRNSDVLSTLKHFPGHGDTSVDSHYALPVVNKSLEELEAMELVPFRALASEADVIMMGHLLVPALDPEYCSTLSKLTISYLRQEIGFDGVVITDSLVMQGVLKQCGSVEEAAIRALEAGCDLLLLGGRQIVCEKVSLELGVEEVKTVHRAIVRALIDGRLEMNRIDEALNRVLKLKINKQY